MNYDLHICYPDNPIIEEKGQIDKDLVLSTFKEYNWDAQIDLLDNMYTEEVHYNPSMSFHEVEGDHIIELTAFRNKDGLIGFSVWLIKNVKKKVFFGLITKEVAQDISADFDVKTSFQLLEQFIKGQYVEVEETIKHSTT